jgi:hypothetical protein
MDKNEMEYVPLESEKERDFLGMKEKWWRVIVWVLGIGMVLVFLGGFIPRS